MTTYLTPRTKFLACIAAVVLSFQAFSPLWAQQPSANAPASDSLQALNPLWVQQVYSLPSEADKLHVVLLVYGHKGGISAACQKDCKSVRVALETAFAADMDRLVFHDLTIKNPKTDKPFTTKETLDAIKTMKVGKNDNVFVFQSGHGGIGNAKDPEMSHKLTMDGGGLTRAQIQKPIEVMKPRSIIFLSDACSGISKKSGGVSEELVSLEEAGPNVQSIRNLMLRPSGVIAVTAAEDGKLAIASFRGANPGKAGSAFTVAFLRLLYADTVYTTWTQFFPALKTETGLASGGKHYARAFQLNDRGIIVASAQSSNVPAVAAREINHFNPLEMLAVPQR